jgi:hypothetical protein
VANPAGSVISHAALLTVTNVAVAPVITSHPQNKTTAVGTTASFSVTATGTAPLAYQWRRNGNPIAGATASTYSLANVQLSDSGSQFTVVVANSAGSVTSQAALLTVTNGVATPVITSQPQSRTNLVGTSATFSVKASGPAPLAYQWMRNGAPIAGAKTSTYTLAKVQLTDSGSQFSVVITNKGGSVSSQIAVLTVTSPPTKPVIVSQPQSRTNTVGTTATFSVAASGTAPLSYQWRRNGAPIAGATTSTYTITNVQLAESGSKFTVVVSNPVGSVTSLAATFVVKAATLPVPWRNQDVGAPGLAGSTVYANGAFTVRGSGSDIWNTSDQFHFVYQKIEGDIEITARVASQQNTDPTGWAKSGVMIRETLSGNSKHAMMIVSPQHGAEFQWRSTAGSQTDGYPTGDTTQAPCWLRIVRRGDSLRGYKSADGLHWELMRTVTVTMGSVVHVGLVVTAHNNQALNTSVFDSVSVRWSDDYAAGTLRREVYLGIEGYQVSNLTSAAKYPNAPDFVDLVDCFESTYLPGNGDENYGQRLSGWLLPPETGNYKFYLASDDAGELWLSTDDEPANKQLIVAETGWNVWRNWQGQANLSGAGEWMPGRSSSDTRLQAGRAYYVEVLHKEALGLDHVSVAWKLPSSPAPANSSLPIQGTYLTSVPPRRNLAGLASVTENQDPSENAEIDIVPSETATITAAQYTAEQETAVVAATQPAQIHSVSSSEGQWIWRMSGEPGRQYLIQSSIDLQHWTDLTAVTTTDDGFATFNAPSIGDHCFFRAHVLP